MKQAIAAAAVLAVAVVGLLAWRSREPGGGGPKRAAGAVAVEVSPVRTSTMHDVGTFTGSLRARSYFTVAPKIPGRLERLTVNIGDRVGRGELVALLEDGEHAQALEQARAGLAVARAAAEQAQSALAAAARELRRAQELRSKRIASESELDTAKARYEADDASHKVALAQVDQREAALGAAEVRLAYTRVRAQWSQDGAGSAERFVGERFVDEGAMLRANEPLVSIVDIDVVVAVIHVVERDYARISLGQEAAVTADAVPARSFTGRVARIAPLLRESSRQARIEIEVPNRKRELKPGMFCRARIEFDEHREATVVPVAALVRRRRSGGPGTRASSAAEQEGWAVFVVELDEERTHGGALRGAQGAVPSLSSSQKRGDTEAADALRARLVPVKVGILEGDLAEILEPELSGRVVTLGQHLLGDGSPVVLAGRSGAGDELERPDSEAVPTGQAPAGGRR